MRLSALTVGWNVIVGGAAVATALVTGSLALIGFGLNAVVDSAASVVLVWRFHAEAAGHAERADGAERLALRLAGIAFLAIAAYLAVEAVRSLSSHMHPRSSWFGIAEAGASLLVLPFLARAKYRLARSLESRALGADSLLTWSGAALSGFALVALVLRSAFGWWWADPAIALVVAAALADQGRRTLGQSTGARKESE